MRYISQSCGRGVAIYCSTIVLVLFKTHVRTVAPIEGTRGSHRGLPLQLHRSL